MKITKRTGRLGAKATDAAAPPSSPDRPGDYQDESALPGETQCQIVVNLNGEDDEYIEEEGDEDGF